ncbi:ABC transporter ATP-binding protein [Haloarchaeobius sp. DFWS5]|uniref:ABC transporter ATP-binding protein n=1 Tax=Haloarchaeobius sp. DFWS5 TaxID=3446114 RepID=UPI003EB81DE3
MTTTQQNAFVDDTGSTDAIMQLRDITVTFDMDSGESRVVDRADLDLRRNEILGIVGESGSGKSMLASSMMDAIEDPGYLGGDVTYNPQSGDPVEVLEMSDSELKNFRWDTVSMVFQGAMSSFNPTLTIRRHFVETLDAHDYNVPDGIEYAKELLSDLYLDPERVLDSYPHELSGGMSQRALIALSMVLDPDVLIMDEPTAALDLLMQRSIISLINELKDKYDLTIALITHDLPLIAELVDRVAVMYAFNLVEIGPVEDVLSGSIHPYTRMLLKATPDIDSPVEEMRPIEGDMPDPLNVPDGCAFNPRCPLADGQCREVDPGAYQATSEHAAKCHYWEAVDEEIPMSEETSSMESFVDSALSTDRRTWQDGDDPIVELDDVEVHFEKEESGFQLFSSPSTIKAVDGVSLEIHERDVTVMLGESGCGKTTLGKTAIGLQRPTGGSIEYYGDTESGGPVDIWQVRDSGAEDGVKWGDIRKSLQIIHQDPGSALNPHRRVSTLLEDPLKRWKPEMDGHDRRARILGLIEHCGMTPPESYIDRYPHQLSGGEQQRMAIIRAMLMNPELILADEPVSALDVSLRVEMMDLMIRLQEEFDTSYFYVSHDMANARYITEKTGGRIGILYLGNLVEVGPPEQIVHNPQHPYTKALRWATPKLRSDEAEIEGDTPLRSIDIPDPENPPSGCPFHTRCPAAREVCKNEMPDSYAGSDAPGHEVSCFRAVNNHQYWSSEPLGEDGDLPDAFIQD